MTEARNNPAELIPRKLVIYTFLSLLLLQMLECMTDNSKSWQNLCLNIFIELFSPEEHIAWVYLREHSAENT